MDLLAGLNLIKANGESAAVDDVLKEKDIVCIYFSAHWCPPCRQFTPILKEFYEEVQDQGVEVIFVSADKTPEDMLSYMRDMHGDWWALAHGSEAVMAIKQKFAVSGIPTVVVCRKDGTVVTKDGRGAVQSKGPGAVKEWKKA